MITEQTKTALYAYSKELVASVLDTLELTGCNEKLCGTIRQLIYDKRDTIIFKLNKGDADYGNKFRN